MIKSKKAVYFLLPVVLVVWGLIFYKVFHAVNNSDDRFNYSTSQVNFSTGDSSITETFNISGNYRDPFLGKIYSDKVEVKTDTKKETGPAKAKQVMQWPVVRYGGMLGNEKNGNLLVMIKIHGTNKLMKAGDEFSGVEITKVFHDSVEVKFLKEKKIFKK
jgi:hypothetical protein